MNTHCDRTGITNCCVASACWIAMALFCACGGSTSESAPGPTRSRLEPLKLLPAGVSVPTPDLRLHRRIFPDEETPWLVHGGRAIYEPGSSGRKEGAAEGAPAPQALVVWGSGRALLRIPGSFDPSAFNSIAIRATVSNPVVFSIDFLQGRRRNPFRVRVPSEGRRSLQTLHFPCPDLALFDEPISKIEIKTEGRVATLRIDWIDLLWQRPESFLPDAAGGADLVHVGAEARRGVALSPSAPLEAHIANSNDRELSFSYALPAFFRHPEDRPVLAVTLQPEPGDAVVRRLPLDEGATDCWATARFDLEAFDGAPLTVRWVLESSEEIACLVGEPAVLHRAAPPRHVLFITSDTHRADYLGASETTIDVRTPVLDALAERGILFTDAFSSANVTNPSHIALMTGTHPRDIGILENNERLDDAAPTLAEAFKSAGYATYAAISARHLNHDTCGLGQGFDRLSSPVKVRDRDCTVVIDQALSWLEAEPDVPTFLWLHVFDAHTPYEPPAEFAELYYPSDRNAFDPDLPPLEGVPPRVDQKEFPGLRDLDYPEAMYRGEVSFLDAELGRLLELSALRDAVIGFTADHGESLGEHDLFYSHDGLYTQSIHVPMILVYPGAPGRLRSSVPVENIDLGRTMLDLAGHPGIDFPGRNLALLAEEPDSVAEPRFALGAHYLTASITRDGWHLVFNLRATYAGQVARTVKHSVELFHLEKDPACSVDLALSEFERARELRAEVLRWLAAAEDRSWRGTRSTDAITLQGLEALGYAADTAEEAPDFAPYDPTCACEWCKRFR